MAKMLVKQNNKWEDKMLKLFIKKDNWNTVSNCGGEDTSNSFYLNYSDILTIQSKEDYTKVLQTVFGSNLVDNNIGSSVYFNTNSNYGVSCKLDYNDCLPEFISYQLGTDRCKYIRDSFDLETKKSLFSFKCNKPKNIRLGLYYSNPANYVSGFFGLLFIGQQTRKRYLVFGLTDETSRSDGSYLTNYSNLCINEVTTNSVLGTGSNIFLDYNWNVETDLNNCFTSNDTQYICYVLSANWYPHTYETPIYLHHLEIE